MSIKAAHVFYHILHEPSKAIITGQKPLELGFLKFMSQRRLFLRVENLLSSDSLYILSQRRLLLRVRNL